MRIDYRNLNTKGWIRQYKRLVPDIDEIIANISEGELKRFEDFFDLPDEKYSAVWSKMQALVMEFLPEMKNYVMGETPRALEVEEVVEMEEQMARQAQAAIRLGFDGVEIHSPHGYLIHSFLSSRSNKRMDRYGGSIENRARFLINIIEKTRAKIGPEKPLGARFSGDECMPGGIDHEESKAFAALARDAGANFINISQGCYENPAAFAPHGEDEFVQYGPGFKEATGLPVIAPGFISPQKAEDAVAGGRIDIVSMGRQAIADPFWPAKVKSGREKDLVKCIRCNHCLMSLQEANWITCKVNPTAGKEQIFPELWRTGSTLEKKTNRFLEKVRGL
jgi:2,4-dienoyl-CoA reductase-like NADH-dependent reductase (Old Yellow Enzyme family)